MIVLGQTTKPAIPEKIVKSGTSTFNITDKSIKIETSPHGVELLDEEFVGEWKVQIQIIATKQ